MRTAVLVGLLVLSATLVHAQNRQLTLRPAAAPVQHEFSRIGSVRELADGRLLVTDVADDALLVVDVRNGAGRRREPPLSRPPGWLAVPAHALKSVIVRADGVDGLATDRDHPPAWSERERRHLRAGLIERAEEGSVVELYAKAR